MIGPGTGVRVYLACGVTDMRKGINGLSALAQDVLRQRPTGGAVFAFRGRRGDRIKLLYWDGQGFCLYYKVLEKGRFPWPKADDGAVRLTSAQLAMLWGEERSAEPIERSGRPFEGTNARSASAGPGRIDWRRPNWGAPPARVG
jgi:transposase